MPNYDFEAANCPAVQTPVATLYAGASPPTPVVGTPVTTGPAASIGLVDLLNADQVRGNLLGRYGGGGYAVWQGLDLSDGGGLTLNVSAGQAGADGPAEKTAAATLALTDNVLNRVWISRLGVLSAVTSASASPLAPPDTATQWVYLGAANCASGVITVIDYSGRVSQLQGSLMWRRTADAGEPGDTPAATVRFLTRTVGGLYLWDGTAYEQISGAVEAVVTDLVTQSSLMDDLERRFRLQLRWTADTLGQAFVHPDLWHEVPLAG